MFKQSQPAALVEKSFCTTREAAALLGVSVGTVQLWVESGLLEAWKTSGGHRRVVRESIERLLHKPDRPIPPPIPDLDTGLRDRKFNILVVDDDIELLRLYETVIGSWNLPCNLMCFDNAVSALLAIGRREPDLLITDLHMPEVDGFEMLRVLGKSPDVGRMQVVVVSGLDEADIESRGGVPPGVTVLPKPIPFGRLLEISSGLLRAASLK